MLFLIQGTSLWILKSTMKGFNILALITLASTIAQAKSKYVKLIIRKEKITFSNNLFLCIRTVGHLFFLYNSKMERHTVCSTMDYGHPMKA